MPLAFDIRNRLPNTGRIPERETIFFDEYKDCFSEDTEEVYLAYGDNITLLKKLKIARREVDKKGTVGRRGKFGGRRVTQPQVHTAADISSGEFSRPDSTSTIVIPAIVIIQPTEMQRQQYGVIDQDTLLVHIPRKWLDDRNIEIDRAEDRLVYNDTQYSIKSKVNGGNFLGSHAEIVMTIRQ